VRSTDENLTSENWEYILDVVDRVSASPSGPSNAIASIIKRLAHRNANVQLYTLELANALSQNCGASIHRELASKAFTDALLRLAGERNTHAQVKQKVLERMGVWTEEFGRKPDFGIMEQAYQKLRREQPGLMPPSKPVKAEISADDRRKEEDELQMALALSIKDGQQKDGGKDKSEGSDSAQTTSAAPQSQHGTTAATVSRVRALYDFTPSEPGELAFRKNDIIAVLESVYKDWWRGSLRGQSGIFPLNYVEKLQDPTKEELERDAQMEGEVFGEIKNVERLLALLSVGGERGGARRGEREEEEIGELYQRTLSIRPKLIELIGKYSQKKDDFTQLNEKFIKARRDYEALLEASMSQPQYHQQSPLRMRQPMYPPQQQPPYAAPQQLPPAGYQQGPPSASAYPPQHQYPQQPQHLPPQQDVQRFYSPAPSEPPGPQPGFTSPYPQSDGPPAQNFQGQIRPNSIHTLNSGNPQELATGGYESPVENRHSLQNYDVYAPQQQQQQAPYSQRDDREGLPSRQRTHSFESTSGPMYASQPGLTQPPQGWEAQQQQQQPPPPQAAMAPGYQAYQPQQQRLPSGGSVGGGEDPGSFYR
ncbi:hypothetical protein BDY17DRAFT_247038, partial [Neohortaea acidophila]